MWTSPKAKYLYLALANQTSSHLQMFNVHLQRIRYL